MNNDKKINKEEEYAKEIYVVRIAFSYGTYNVLVKARSVMEATYFILLHYKREKTIILDVHLFPVLGFLTENGMEE